MHIEYENEKVEKWLEREAPYYGSLKRKMPAEMLKILIKRKNALVAAERFGIYLTTGLGKPHPLEGNLDDCYGISLTANYRLIVKPKVSILTTEMLNSCDTIIIKGVEDYHGGKSNWIVP